MVEEIDIDAYLRISPNKFGIYLLNTTNKTHLYNQELEIQNDVDVIDFNILNNFLKDNVFKIEKLLGRFLKNIILIIDTNKIKRLFIGIKRKNFESKIGKQFLENSLIDAKDLFKENYKDQKILHMIIKRYFLNNKHYFSFEDVLQSDHICLEIEFRSISEIYLLQINNILEKYQIKIIRYIDGGYVKNYFHDDLEISDMTHKILTGYNENEVTFISKNPKKLGFFERFFQLFS